MELVGKGLLSTGATASSLSIPKNYWKLLFACDNCQDRLDYKNVFGLVYASWSCMTFYRYLGRGLNKQKNVFYPHFVDKGGLADVDKQEGGWGSADVYIYIIIGRQFCGSPWFGQLSVPLLYLLPIIFLSQFKCILVRLSPIPLRLLYLTVLLLSSPMGQFTNYISQKWLTDWMNELINNEGVCGTAPHAEH